MFYLYTYLLSVPSPIIWMISSETWAVLVGLNAQHPWWWVGLTLGFGQTTGFCIIYLFGGGMVRLIPKLRQKLEKFQANKNNIARYAKAAGFWMFISAFIGIPPLTLLAILAPAFHIRLLPFALITLAGRTIRFCLLAGLPFLFADWFPPGLLPDFLTRLL